LVIGGCSHFALFVPKMLYLASFCTRQGDHSLTVQTAQGPLASLAHLYTSLIVLTFKSHSMPSARSLASVQARKVLIVFEIREALSLIFAVIDRIIFARWMVPRKEAKTSTALFFLFKIIGRRRLFLYLDTTLIKNCAGAERSEAH